MRGKNLIRKPIIDDGSKLEVKKIFATLQGEGVYAGMPSVFVRLGGCNLACDFCDTDFEDFSIIELADIIKQVVELSKNDNGSRVRKLVVITGGEPLRQNIVPLCEELIKDNFKVQIETNGTLYSELPESVDIICSPKNTGSGYAMLREDLLARLTALKFLISASDKRYKDVPEIGQDKYKIQVFVQPMDENDADKNEENKNLALKLATKHGYRLSLQLHKILEIE